MSVENALYLIGAYGRQCLDIQETKQQWEAGKDFKIDGGPYCSIRDIEKMRERGYRALIFKPVGWTVFL